MQGHQIYGHLVADHVIIHTWLEDYKPTEVYKNWMEYIEKSFFTQINLRQETTLRQLEILSGRPTRENKCIGQTGTVKKIFGILCGGFSSFVATYCNHLHGDSSLKRCVCDFRKIAGGSMSTWITRPQVYITRWFFWTASVLSLNLTFLHFNLIYKVHKCEPELVRIKSITMILKELCGRLPISSFYPGHYKTITEFHSLYDSHSRFRADFQVIQVDHIMQKYENNYLQNNFEWPTIYNVYSGIDRQLLAIYILIVKKYLQLKCITSQVNSFYYYDGPGLQSEQIYDNKAELVTFRTFQGLVVVNSNDLTNSSMIVFWGVMYSSFHDGYIDRNNANTLYLPNDVCRSIDFCILNVTRDPHVLLQIEQLIFYGPNEGNRYGGLFVYDDIPTNIHLYENVYGHSTSHNKVYENIYFHDNTTAQSNTLNEVIAYNSNYSLYFESTNADVPLNYTSFRDTVYIVIVSFEKYSSIHVKLSLRKSYCQGLSVDVCRLRHQHRGRKGYPPFLKGNRRSPAEVMYTPQKTCFQLQFMIRGQFSLESNCYKSIRLENYGIDETLILQRYSYYTGSKTTYDSHFPTLFHLEYQKQLSTLQRLTGTEITEANDLGHIWLGYI